MLPGRGCTSWLGTHTHFQHTGSTQISAAKDRKLLPSQLLVKLSPEFNFLICFFSDFQNFDDVLFRQTLRSELEDVSKSLLMCFTCAPSGWGELLNLLRLKKRYLLDIGIKSNYIIW